MAMKVILCECVFFLEKGFVRKKIVRQTRPSFDVFRVFSARYLIFGLLSAFFAIGALSDHSYG